MFEIRHLRLLKTLAETGNLSRAGRELNLSQPAVSRQMRDLEEHCGCALFERKSQPLRFTPAGTRLLDTAFSVLSEVNQADREIARIREGRAGQLRIAVECHSCFDWLMPSMDAFRASWPDVEMDLVSGFHPDPVGLILEDLADVVLVSHAKARAGIVFHPLFRYEVWALLPHGHRLLEKRYLTARDFERETLITYPIPDERIDVIREVLGPAGINPVRRTTELTVAILQLIASRRGIAAMPGWAVQPYLERDYVVARPIRRNGVFTDFHMATSRSTSTLAYMIEFLRLTRKISTQTLHGIQPL